MTEEKTKIARDLLIRAANSPRTPAEAVRSALNSIAGVDDVGADENWFRDYFKFTGEHVVLTEEGWMPAALNTREHTGFDPAEVLDELNAPTA